jgi:hypothetical protein
MQLNWLADTHLPFLVTAGYRWNGTQAPKPVNPRVGSKSYQTRFFLIPEWRLITKLKEPEMSLSSY